MTSDIRDQIDEIEQRLKFVSGTALTIEDAPDPGMLKAAKDDTDKCLQMIDRLRARLDELEGQDKGHNLFRVHFDGEHPLRSFSDGAHPPMIPSSWRYGFYENNGTLCFGPLDEGELVVWDAVKDAFPDGGESPAPQPEPVVPDHKGVQELVREHVDHYEFRGDGGDYMPNDTERLLIEDAIQGLLADDRLVSMLTAAPPAGQSEGEARLPCDVTVGSGTFRKGVKLQTFVDAARRWYALAQQQFQQTAGQSEGEVKAEGLEEMATAIERSPRYESVEGTSGANDLVWCIHLCHKRAARLRGNGEES